MGIQPTPPQPIAGKGKHIGLVVVPTVEPYLFLDKRSEIWINTTLIRLALPQWAYSYCRTSLGRRILAETADKCYTVCRAVRGNRNRVDPSVGADR
jgi:hypothetical protein